MRLFAFVDHLQNCRNLPSKSTSKKYARTSPGVGRYRGHSLGDCDVYSNASRGSDGDHYRRGTLRGDLRPERFWRSPAEPRCPSPALSCNLVGRSNPRIDPNR